VVRLVERLGRLLVVAPLAYAALVAVLRVSGARTLSKLNARPPRPGRPCSCGPDRHRTDRATELKDGREEDRVLASTVVTGTNVVEITYGGPG
jgi:hypothetical protein